MAYQTPRAVEMAVKEAAKASDQDTNRAIASFYYRRFLCRVFSEPDSRFVLKGGRGILARTTRARYSRDADVAADFQSVDEALGALKKLAMLDLGDFVVFEFARAEPIKVEDDYREGLRVSFDVIMGAKRLQPLLVDLVVDKIPYGETDLIAPVDRLAVGDLPVFDYRVVPAAYAVADKVCGIVEQHGDLPSSRVKDLVDVLVYASIECFDGTDLERRLKNEMRFRSLAVPGVFHVPGGWHRNYGGVYGKLAREAGLADSCATLDDAERKAAQFLDPVLAGAVRGKRWNCGASAWA